MWSRDQWHFDIDQNQNEIVSFWSKNQRRILRLWFWAQHGRHFGGDVAQNSEVHYWFSTVLAPYQCGRTIHPTLWSSSVKLSLEAVFPGITAFGRLSFTTNDQPLCCIWGEYQTPPLQHTSGYSFGQECSTSIAAFLCMVPEMIIAWKYFRFRSSSYFLETHYIWLAQHVTVKWAVLHCSV